MEPAQSSPAGSLVGKDSLSAEFANFCAQYRAAQASPNNPRKSPAPLSEGAAETADKVEADIRPTLTERAESPKAAKGYKATVFQNYVDIETIRRELVDVRMAVTSCSTAIREAYENLLIVLQKGASLEYLKGKFQINLSFVAKTNEHIEGTEGKISLVDLQIQMLLDNELLGLKLVEEEAQKPSAPKQDLEHLKDQLKKVKSDLSLAKHDLMRFNLLRYASFALTSLERSLLELNDDLAPWIKSPLDLKPEVLNGFKKRHSLCRKEIENLLVVTHENQSKYLYHFFDLNVGSIYCTDIDDTPPPQRQSVAQIYKKKWGELIVNFYNAETLIIHLTNEANISASLIELKRDHLVLSSAVRTARGDFSAKKDVNEAELKKAIKKEDREALQKKAHEIVEELKANNLEHQDQFQNIMGRWLAVSVQHRDKADALEGFKNLKLLPLEWLKLTNYLPDEMRDYTQKELKSCVLDRSRRFYSQLRGWEVLIEDFDTFPPLSTAMAIDWGTTAVAWGYYFKLSYYINVSRLAGYGEMEKLFYSHVSILKKFSAAGPTQKDAWERLIAPYLSTAITQIPMNPDEQKDPENKIVIKEEIKGQVSA